MWASLIFNVAIRLNCDQWYVQYQIRTKNRWHPDIVRDVCTHVGPPLRCLHARRFSIVGMLPQVCMESCSHSNQLLDMFLWGYKSRPFRKLAPTASSVSPATPHLLAASPYCLAMGSLGRKRVPKASKVKSLRVWRIMISPESRLFDRARLACSMEKLGLQTREQRSAIL